MHRRADFWSNFLEVPGLRWPGDSQRESGRFVRIDSQNKINYFHNVRAARANRLEPAIRNCLVPRNAVRKKGGLVREPWNDSRESGDSRESVNRFARIRPSKFRGLWSKLLRSCPKLHCVWWFPHKGNFWEVRGQLLKIPPKTPTKFSEGPPWDRPAVATVFLHLKKEGSGEPQKWCKIAPSSVTPWSILWNQILKFKSYNQYKLYWKFREIQAKFK